MDSTPLPGAAPPEATTVADKFVSVLESIGKKLETPLADVLKVAQGAEPFITALNPALGAIFSTTVGVVLNVEQKFAAMNKQSGTGVQKLAEATAILGPLLTQALSVAGKPADAATVQNYINTVVALLNATPAAA